MSKSITEVKHAVFEYFANESVFCPSKQADLIKLDGDKEMKIAIVQEALRDLEKYEVVKGFVSDAGTKYWALTRPLPSFDKVISFGYDTLSLVSEALNRYAETQGVHKFVTDPSAVTDRDIQRLALVCSALMPQTESTTEEKSS